ncbi:MAG: NUDIX hydrolase [Paracoccus denitrificans]|uniref:NUDIX hydrolase n=1 Tax=Paracoccus denitrificans TaxID=266 RepID=A0A533I914_PARDE|nr:MAG: NUDIX hydrolase [Paracoccus denitrificans]
MNLSDDSGAGRDPTALRDAATVMVVRRGPAGPSVLMGMRGTNAAFMPSKFVFPGGAVDPEDAADMPLSGQIEPHTLDRLMIDLRPESTVTAKQIVVAALRELAEETGLLIAGPGQGTMVGYADQGVMPDLSHLHFVFRAITPPGRPRRFDARFFLVDAAHVHGDPDDFSKACDELSNLHWVPMAEARRLALPFITEVVLAECAAMVTAAGDGPFRAPASVPFFDNREARSRFVQIGADP